MERGEWIYRFARPIARRFLTRWNDPLTRSLIEELSHDAAIEVWRAASRVHQPDRLSAYVRTVARRVRRLALRRVGSALPICRATDPSEVAAEVEATPCVRVEGRWIDRDWLLDRIAAAGDSLGGTNRQLVNAIYAGGNCRELAAEHGLGINSVKARLHRSRRSLHQEYVGLARREFVDVWQDKHANQERKDECTVSEVVDARSDRGVFRGANRYCTR